MNRVAAACRAAGILVIHTAHVLRPDGSNVGVLGELVPSVREEGFLYDGSPTAAFHPDLDIEPGDILLKKPRFGAFYGTDLETILRSHGIDTLVITGISTDVCCDTTAREANARDFRVLVVSDATGVNAETEDDARMGQELTLRLIDGMFGEVVSSAELFSRIS